MAITFGTNKAMTIIRDCDTLTGVTGADGLEGFGYAIQGTDCVANGIRKNNIDTITITPAANITLDTQAQVIAWAASSVAHLADSQGLRVDGTTGTTTLGDVKAQMNGWFQPFCFDATGIGNLTNIDWEFDSGGTSVKVADNIWVDVSYAGNGIDLQGTTVSDTLFTEGQAYDESSDTYNGVLTEREGVIFSQHNVYISTTSGNSYGETLVFFQTLFGLNNYTLEGSGTADFIGTNILTSGTVTLAIDWTSMTSFDMDGGTIVGASTVDFAAGQTATGVVFNNAGTIGLSSADVHGSTFIGCGQITHAGADSTNVSISGYEGTANTSALLYNQNADPDGEFDGMTFTKGTAATHAIEFGTSVPSAMTLRNCTFTGYNAGNTQNDSTFHFKDTAGTITLSLVGCSGNFSYRSDGATIVIVADPVTVKVVAQTAAGTKLENARVLLKTSATAVSGLPYDVTVTITNSGTTASVSHTAHGMSNGDKVIIDGASLNVNNGVFTISNVTTNAYDYTLASAPGSSPTGTIKASFVYLEGLTDVNGEITLSRVLPADQSAVGWARKSSASPFYKTGPVAGTVSSSSNTTLSAVLTLDE